MNKHVVICTFVFLTFLNPVHGAPTQIEISRYQTDLNCARPTTYLPVNFNFKQYMKAHSNKQIEAFIEFVANHTCQEITTEAEDIFYIENMPHTKQPYPMATRNALYQQVSDIVFSLQKYITFNFNIANFVILQTKDAVDLVSFAQQEVCGQEVYLLLKDLLLYHALYIDYEDACSRQDSALEAEILHIMNSRFLCDTVD